MKWMFGCVKDPPEVWGGLGQALLLDLAVFKGRLTNGFFLEAGGVDFEHGKAPRLHFELLAYLMRKTKQKDQYCCACFWRILMGIHRGAVILTNQRAWGYMSLK